MLLISNMKTMPTTLTFLAVSAGAAFAHFSPLGEPIEVLRMTKSYGYIEIMLDTSHIRTGTSLDCVAYDSDGMPVALNVGGRSERRVTKVNLFGDDIPSQYSVECYPD